MSRLDDIAANSFRNFHAKGFDYLCLHRSPELTLKAYFFDEVVASNPELVMPHDHRYGFMTTVLNGRVSEMLWRPYDASLPPYRRGIGHIFQEFEYATPLNGGSGFAWVKETVLESCAGTGYHRGQSYWTRSDRIHTLARVQPGTVIILQQFADEIPVGQPTKAFSRKDKTPPNLDGLYERMDEDHVIARITQLRDLGWPTDPLLEPAA